MKTIFKLALLTCLLLSHLANCDKVHVSENEAEVEHKPEPEDEAPKFKSTYSFDVREAMLEKEKSMAIGGSIKLNEKEKMVNQVLMHYKHKEIDACIENKQLFPPSRHFFNAKQDIEASDVFKFLRKVPKGANLHVHLSVATAGEYLYDITFMDDLYICQNKTQWSLKFFGDDIPEDHWSWKKHCDWQLVKDLREQDPEFEDWLKSKFSMVTDDPHKAYPTTQIAWEAFEERVKGIKEMLHYWPVFADQFYQMLEEMHHDNVMYVEFRSQATRPQLLNASDANVDALSYWVEILRGFKEDNPGFWGAKLVYTHSRHISNGFLLTVLNTFNKYLKAFPNFVGGLDLSGYEDKANELKGFSYFIKDLPHVTNLILHGGETNWYGSTDNNLLDIVLMDAKRIGHGLALPKHPEVMRLVKEKAIAVEVCPISNQVFRYVDDMRNHPAAVLFANDVPVVICNDGPSLWGYTGLSYDWYMAFMGIASRDADLRMLKQLAINSILYSTLEGEEKYDALDFWQQKWNEFIDDMIIEHKDSDILLGMLNETNVSNVDKIVEDVRDEL